jgi:dephospho-CoA kinase
MARDGCSREEALRRIRAQMPLAEKQALADHVIDNSGSPEETERQVRALWQRLSRPRAAEP